MMPHSIHHILPYPTNKPSDEDIDLYEKDYPHLREYPNGKKIRISDPKPDRVYLTVPLMDEVLTAKLAAEVPIDQRCMAVSQMLKSVEANTCVVPKTCVPAKDGAYDKKFQLEVGISGALLWCELRGATTDQPTLILRFNPSRIGPQGHQAIADLLFGASWPFPAASDVHVVPPIFRQERFAHYAKLNQIDFAVDCTGISPSELLLRHSVVDASALYCTAGGLGTEYLKNASQPHTNSLVKAYDKTAEASQNGCEMFGWPQQVTRIEVTRKGLKHKYLEDIYGLHDPFKRLRCGYRYAQGYPCYRKLDTFIALRRFHDLHATAERMNLADEQSAELEWIVHKVPKPDLVRPKQTFQTWKSGCSATGIDALLPV